MQIVAPLVHHTRYSRDEIVCTNTQRQHKGSGIATLHFFYLLSEEIWIGCFS